VKTITPEEAYVEIESLKLDLVLIKKNLEELEEKLNLALEFLGGEGSIRKVLFKAKKTFKSE